MAKLKLPTADSFLAMLDRIPDDDEIKPLASVAPPSPIPEPAIAPVTISTVSIAPIAIQPADIPSVAVAPVADVGIIQDQIDNQSAISSAIKSTNNKAINHSNNQSDSQISKQDNNQSVKQTKYQTIKLSNKQTHKQTSSISNKQSQQLSIEQTNQPSSQQLLQQLIQQSVQQSPQQTREPVLIRSDALAWLPLTKNQGQILLFLYQKGGGLTNMDLIIYDTGIPYGTARSALEALIREGYVSNKKRFVGHAFRGFSYEINNEMCDQYVARVLDNQSAISQQSVQQLVQQSIKQTTQQPARQTIEQTIGSSINQAGKPKEEVSFEERLTSSKPQAGGIELNDAELRWWAAQGLTTAKTAEWLRQFADQGLIAQDLAQSLRYAWFDAAVNQIKPAGKPIDRPLNWFFSFLPGGYARPTNYKTQQQLELEREQAELDELEQQARQLTEIRRKKRKALLELQFQQILAGEGEEYQTLLGAVNSFEREMGGDVLENAMRLKFYEQHGVQG